VDMEHGLNRMDIFRFCGTTRRNKLDPRDIQAFALSMSGYSSKIAKLPMIITTNICLDSLESEPHLRHSSAKSDSACRRASATETKFNAYRTSFSAVSIGPTASLQAPPSSELSTLPGPSWDCTPPGSASISLAPPVVSRLGA